MYKVKCASFLAIGMVFCFSLFPSAHAEVRKTSNLGGFPISCSITNEQAALAGIHPWDSVAKVESILGMPDNVSSENGRLFYNYAGKVKIHFASFGGNGFTVHDITADGNSSAATPGGVMVGMPDTVLNQVYGTADTVYIKKAITPKLTDAEYERYQKRYNTTAYEYNVNQVTSMHFLTRNGIIESIIVSTTD